MSIKRDKPEYLRGILVGALQALWFLLRPVMAAAGLLGAHGTTELLSHVREDPVQNAGGA